MARRRGCHQARCLPSAGELYEMLTLLVVDFVQVAQVSDVPGAGATLACFQAAELGRADQQAFGHLLGGPALPVPERLEQRSELPAADDWASCVVHFSPAPSYGRQMQHSKPVRADLTAFGQNGTCQVAGPTPSSA